MGKIKHTGRPKLTQKLRREIQTTFYLNPMEHARFNRLVKHLKDKQYARTIRRAIFEQADRLGIK